MDYEELLQLIDKLDQSSLAYLSYAKGDHKVELSKEAGLPAAPSSDEPKTVATPMPAENSTGVSSSPATETENTAKASEDTGAAAEGEEVLSPMVGVAFLQESPEEDPFVQVGDYVKEGDTVILIEAMKLMTEIHAHTSGKVTDICVENEEVVEYNQPLVKIKPQS